jgi:phosphoribosyl-ATP pyrophosphohydrolase/phosphoribosyl-AMP cyclohydrolase
MSELELDALDFTKGNGLVTVVAQHAHTGAVLMVAHADREALEHTVRTGEMHYRSRTRGLWHKGATSGHVQQVVSLSADCDGDAVLARVLPAGPACHTGAVSCFAQGEQEGAEEGAEERAHQGDRQDPPAPRAPQRPAADPLTRLDAVIAARATNAAATGERPSYTRTLLANRNLRLKKLGEEAAELAVACADHDRERAIEEAADLLYHTLVALRPLGAGVEEIRAALAAREG